MFATAVDQRIVMHCIIIIIIIMACPVLDVAVPTSVLRA